MLSLTPHWFDIIPESGILVVAVCLFILIPRLKVEHPGRRLLQSFQHENMGDGR